MCMLSHYSCPIPCSSVDCSPSDTSVRGILQAVVLEWVALPTTRGSSRLPGIEPVSPPVPALRVDFLFLPLSHWGSPTSTIFHFSSIRLWTIKGDNMNKALERLKPSKYSIDVHYYYSSLA